MDGIDLKAERVRARIKQQDLARALGVSRATLIAWENHNNLPEWKALAYREAVRTFADVSRAAA